MDISHDSAMRVVIEMSSIIRHDVNMMDERGVIIASTDPARLGTFHGGAYEVLRRGFSELIVSFDGQYPGTREGINLPICFEGAAVGVIGITGSGEEVHEYGQIIKKMTEILLLDSWRERQKQLRVAIWSQFMEEWLFSSEKLITERFVKRGIELGVDLRKSYQLFVIALKKRNDAINEQERLSAFQRVEEEIRQIVRVSAGGFYYKLPFQYVCFISPVSEKKLREMATFVGERVERCGFHAFIGIDAQIVSCEHVRNAYEHASKALRFAVQNGKSLFFYDEINLDILISNIPFKVREDFITHLFRSCPQSQRDKFMVFLSVYFNRSGSIQTVAQELHLHKNTVQYKLRRIYKLFGLDPRDLKNSAIFQIALAIYKTLRSNAMANMLHL